VQSPSTNQRHVDRFDASRSRASSRETGELSRLFFCRLRVALSAAHTLDDVAALIDALSPILRKVRTEAMLDEEGLSRTSPPPASSLAVPFPVTEQRGDYALLNIQLPPEPSLKIAGSDSLSERLDDSRKAQLAASAGETVGRCQVHESTEGKRESVSPLRPKAWVQVEVQKETEPQHQDVDLGLAASTVTLEATQVSSRIETLMRRSRL
jgi:hypothetical protein